MHHLIFIPGDGICNPKKLSDIGLPEHAANASIAPTHYGPHRDFPQGALRRGVICSWSISVPSAFDAKSQSWTESADGKYWIGLIRGEPLSTPRELALDCQIEGALTTLGDGNRWILPSVETLNQRIMLAEHGQIDLARYGMFVRDAARWFTAMLEWDFDAEKNSIDADVVDFLIDALRLNYRLPPDLARRMNLFTAGNIANALVNVTKGLKLEESELAQAMGAVL
jgi:hypothetical protein